ncbi:GtrA family protein [Paenibacillus sp. GD4]|uniref:GtrA family protein n=1 Tax=Paenibacillus sp. GD4 TaxID=3068890 RepID=UPI00358E5FE9
MNKSNSVKQLIRFITTGTLAVTTDSICYYLLSALLSISLAKSISFLLGTCVAYIFNKFWTFEKKHFSSKELFKFLLLYSLTLGANVITNKSVLFILEEQFIFAFFIATGVSTVLNFIGQKWWVFRSDVTNDSRPMLQRGEKYTINS